MGPLRCAVHCAATASTPGLFSALGLGAWMGHEAEWGFTLVAALFAAAAVIHGWRRHRSMGIVTAFGVGIAALLLSRALEEGGPPELGTAAGVLAGAVLVMAHVLKLRSAPHRMRTSCAASSAAELADS